MYTKGTVIFKLWEKFSGFLSGLTKPACQHLFNLVLSILALNGFKSVKFSYDHFMKQISERGLKSYYYTLSKGKTDIQSLMDNLIRMALTLPAKEEKQPLVISIDDTMVEKFGKKFEHCSTLFDHAAHNGTNYLNGHCFVSMLLSTPICDDGGKRYISFPVAYRMWTHKSTKLEMAAEMVRSAMRRIGQDRQTILCCDSWYPKGPVKELVDEFSNLTLICSVRSDTALYALPPERTGKRGRPSVRGERISLEDFPMEDIPGTDYKVGVRPVMTDLFKRRIMYAIVTQSKSGKSRRLFLCSRNPEELCFDLAFLNNDNASAYARHNPRLLPLTIYSMRWAIEVAYYEQKQFWSLRDYRVRTRNGIERLVNLLTLTYAFMKLLSYLSEDFSIMKECGAQQTRFVLGSLVQQQIFLSRFVERPENVKNNRTFFDTLQSQFLASWLVA